MAAPWGYSRLHLDTVHLVHHTIQYRVGDRGVRLYSLRAFLFLFFMAGCLQKRAINYTMQLPDVLQLK